MPRQPKKPEIEWEAQKVHIHAYYIVENNSLEKTMERMKLDHNFDATKKEYTRRFQLWKISKYMKKEEWKLVHEGSSRPDEIHTLLVKRRINQKRCKRALARYRPEFDESFQALVSTRPFDASALATTSSSTACIHVTTMTIPWLKFEKDHNHLLLSMIKQFIPSLPWLNPFGSPFAGYSSGELCLQSAKNLLGSILRIEIDAQFTTQILKHLHEILPKKSGVKDDQISREPFFLLIQSCIYLSSNGYLQLDQMDQFLSWILDSGSASLLMQSLHLPKETNSPTIKIFLSRLLRSAVILERADVVLTLLHNQVDMNSGVSSSYYQHELEIWDQPGALVPGFIVAMTAFINPLQIAVFKGNVSICKLLLDYHSDPNLVSPMIPISPLELALNQGDSSIFDMLLGSFSRINRHVLTIKQFDNNAIYYSSPTFSIFAHEDTILIKAVKVQNISIVESLLRRGVSVNEPTLLSGTPLQVAVMNNDDQMVRILLRAGAEVNIVASIEHWAKKFFIFALEKFSRQIKFLRDEQRFNIISANDESEEDDIFDFLRLDLERSVQWEAYLTPLQVAARQDNLVVVQYLLNSGANINENPDWNSIWEHIPAPTDKIEAKTYEHLKTASMRILQTPLHQSVANGNPEMTRILLGDGSFVNYANGLGETPLHLACGVQKDEEETELQLSERRVHLVELLLNFGADVNCLANPPPTTVLHTAVKTGDESLIRLLLQSGVEWCDSPNNPDVPTILQAAATTGKLSLIDFLASNGFSPTPEIFWIALHVEASKGNILAVKKLLERGVDVNCMCRPNGLPEISGSLLQSAIQSGNLVIVQMLLDAGAHVDEMADGETALCTAIRSENWDIFKLLLMHEADPSPPHATVTPLSIAAAKGHWNMAKRLLMAKAKVDQLSQSPEDYNIRYELHSMYQVHQSLSTTPLFWVLWRCRFIIIHTLNKFNDEEKPWRELENLEAIVSLLLAHGADSNAGPENKASIFTVACSLDFLVHPEIRVKTDILIQRLVKMILGYGVNLNAPDYWGRFPIQVAARDRRKEVVQIMLDTGAIEFNTCGTDIGEKALEWAVSNAFEDEEVPQMLLRAIPPLSDAQMGTVLTHSILRRYFNLAFDLVHDGADVNGIWIGESALVHAAMRGHTKLVQLLISRGAEVNPTNCWPSPLACTADFNKFNIAKILLENGADVNHSPACAKGDTALKRAAFWGRLDMVHLLLENDDQLDMIESRCKEAALIAEKYGHVVLARIMRDYRPHGDRGGQNT